MFATSNALVCGKLKLWVCDGRCIVDLTPEIVAKVILIVGC